MLYSKYREYVDNNLILPFCIQSSTPGAFFKLLYDSEIFFPEFKTMSYCFVSTTCIVMPVTGSNCLQQNSVFSIMRHLSYNKINSKCVEFLIFQLCICQLSKIENILF